MACEAENIRQQDKNTTWQNARADQATVRNIALAADATMVGACIAAVFSLGGAAPLCAAAVIALGLAVAQHEVAIDKSNIAGSAYKQALADYRACLAKLS